MKRNFPLAFPEESIIEMLRALPEKTLVEIFSKILIESDSSPLTDDEETSYNKALEEHEKGEVITWESLK
jgi:hypothetical protein